MTTEQFAVHEGYLVGNLGTICNLDGKTLYTNVSQRNYYYKLAAWGKTYLVHRLVAEAWIPNPENKPQVNHIDGNKLNNKVSNLEWVTAKENVGHSISVLGRSVGQKLTRDEVVAIRLLYKQGSHSQRKLAEAFHVTQNVVKSIVKRQTYREVV